MCIKASLEINAKNSDTYIHIFVIVIVISYIYMWTSVLVKTVPQWWPHRESQLWMTHQERPPCPLLVSCLVDIKKRSFFTSCAFWFQDLQIKTWRGERKCTWVWLCQTEGMGGGGGQTRQVISNVQLLVSVLLTRLSCRSRHQGRSDETACGRTSPGPGMPWPWSSPVWTQPGRQTPWPDERTHTKRKNPVKLRC